MNSSAHDPLQNVVTQEPAGAVLAMQSGLFRLAYNRALASGTTVARAEDIQALDDHALAMAKETFREKFDPEQHTHDAMHQAEYERSLAQREDAERGEQQAGANLRDSEQALALAPKAGPKPKISNWLLAAFMVVFSITVAPTLHDSVFHTFPDDLLAWLVSSVCSAFVGAMLCWGILGGRQSKWSWIGVSAGVALGIGLLAVRLSSTDGAGEVWFAIGLTVVEIAAVLLLEFLARDLRAKDAEWNVKHAAEAEALAHRDACQQDLSRWQARVREKHQGVIDKIALVEDRFNRNIHIEELEQAAVKAVRDGYNRGVAENIGRIHGVARRTQ
jgi:hypothetical protein